MTAERIITGDWKKIAEQVYAENVAKIPAEWRLKDASLLAPAQVFHKDLVHVEPSNVFDILKDLDPFTPEETAITSASATEIVAKIAAGEWSAVEVTTAFCKRAAIVQQLTRACTELFFDKALAQAKELDAYFQKTGKVVGPLHGLPVSLKDQINVTGIRTTTGFASWAEEIATSDGLMAEVLRKQGAVLYVKTNIPQSMMSAESTNVLYGRACNPYDRNRTSGGSSGGEGVLIALQGSPLGIGSDIAGSIRIPSAMCGIYGLKPSVGRSTLKGALAGGCLNLAVGVSSGPMANHVEDLELFMKAWCAAEPWLKDIDMLPIPWREVTLPKKLKFGLLTNNNSVAAHPPITRMLHTVADALTAAGHEVIPWDVGDLHYKVALENFVAFNQDGGASLKSHLDPTGEPSLFYDVTDKWNLDAKGALDNYKRIAAYKTENLDHWNESGIDAILSPVSSHVAVPHDRYNDSFWTGPVNAFDLASCAFPVGFVDAEKDQVTEEWLNYKPTGRGVTGSSWTEGNDTRNHAAYTDAKDWEGLPIVLQLMTRRLEEEKCLAIVKVIRDLMRK